MTENELQELIKLKRYEQPEEGYYDNFLKEFQERQRSEMLRTSARDLFMERVRAWFNFSNGTNRLVFGGGVACAVFVLSAIAMYFVSNIDDEQQIAKQVADLPADNTSSSSDVLMLSIRDSAQVSSDLVREQLQPIDFSKPELGHDSMLPFENIIF